VAVDIGLCCWKETNPPLRSDGFDLNVVSEVLEPVDESECLLAFVAVVEIDAGKGLIHSVEMVQMQLQHEAVMEGAPSAQRRFQFHLGGAEALVSQGGQDCWVGLAGVTHKKFNPDSHYNQSDGDD